MNYLLISGFSLLVLWGIGNLFTGLLQRYFIMRPKKSGPDARYDFQHLFRELWFHPDENTRLHALWFQAQERPPRGVILYFHGNAGNLERWGEIGPRFTTLGYDILIPDYAGFGKSTGKIREKELVRDARHIWKFLKENYPSVPAYIYGRSMGSGIACSLAAEADADGLILETPFSGMKRLFYTYYPFLPPLFIFRFTFPNLENLKKCECPVLIFAGTRDWVVPYRCAKELKAVLKTGDEFVTIAGGGHAHLSTFEIYKEKLNAFLLHGSVKSPGRIKPGGGAGQATGPHEGMSGNQAGEILP